MKVETKIQKWGNGLALRVSGVMRDVPHFKEGTLVEVEVSEDGFLVRKSQPKQEKCFPFSEAQLLEDITPDLAHADLLAKPTPKEMGEI